MRRATIGPSHPHRFRHVSTLFGRSCRQPHLWISKHSEWERCYPRDQRGRMLL